MDREEWLKIQQNWEYLRHQLKAEYVLDMLASCQDKVLNEEDEQRIRCESVDVDKNVKLLKILKSKPENANAYKNLLQALEKVQPLICERLNATTIDQSELQGSPPNDITSMVREVLLENFEDKPGESCSLLDVREAVTALRYSGVYFDWKNTDLQKFVTEVFTGVRFEPGGKKKLPKFINLGPKKIAEDDNSTTETQASAPSESGSCANGNSTPVSTLKDLDVTELCKCLEPIIKDLGIPQDVFEKFKEMEIDGLVFLRMEDKHFEKYFPDISFGKRMRLMIARENLAQHLENASTEKQELLSASQDLTNSNVPMYREFFRTFDTPVDATDRYKKGSIMTLAGFTRENMIHPVRTFIAIDKNPQSNINKIIAQETVRFAAACLNDRTNGTIYAGISERETNECHEGEVVGIPIDKSECEKVLKKLISQAFYEDQHETVFRAIRSAKFVQVDSSQPGQSLYVVEIDIVPSAKLVGEEVFFVKSSYCGGRKKERRAIVFRCMEGSLRSLSEKEVFEYTKKKKSLTALRAETRIAEFRCIHTAQPEEANSQPLHRRK